MNNDNLSAMIDTWLQFTLDNPLYAIAIAVGVFILTAILYSFRVSSLTKKLNLSDKTRQNAETQYADAQQQLQDSQAQLTRALEQVEQQQKALEIEKQRAVELAQHISERNERITATVQKLASSFDIGERPVVTADFKAEDLWQQHNKIIEQFIDNLRTAQQAQTELQAFYQAEKHKVTEIENRLNTLQTQLDNQINLVSTLQSQNLTLQEQNSTLQQQLLQTQQTLKQQADAAHLLQSEQPALTRVAETPTIDDSAEKLKNLFKKPTSVPEPVESANTVIEPSAPVIEQPTIVESPVEPITPVINQEEKLDDTQPTPTTIQIMPESELVPIEPTPVATPEPAPVEPEKDNMVKGWYQKLTNKTEPNTAPEPTPVATPEPAPVELEKDNMVKGWYQKLTNKIEPDTAPEPTPVVKPEPKPTTETETETETKTSVLKNLAKFTNKKTEVVEEDDSGIEDLADKLTEKLEKFSKWFSKKDND